MAIPDCTADKLRKLIAGYLGVDASRVTDATWRRTQAAAEMRFD